MLFIHRVRHAQRVEVCSIRAVLGNISEARNRLPPQTAEQLSSGLWFPVVVGVLSAAFIRIFLDTSGVTSELVQCTGRAND